MKTTLEKPTVAADGNATFAALSREPLMRRDFLTGAAAIGATFVLPRELAAAATGKKTFTILHTNDMHASFIGMGPASDYTPFTLNDDTTRGCVFRTKSATNSGMMSATDSDLIPATPI